MCGNQISTVAAPSSQFRTMIQSQIAANNIRLINKQLAIPQINQIKDLMFNNVLSLQLINCNITADTIKLISQLNWQQLNKLNLNNNQIGPQGCKIIAEAPSFNNLQILQLNSNKIKDQGLQYLAQGTYKNKLQDLAINDNSITNRGISKISKKFDTLHCFSAGGNQLDDSTIDTLSNSLNVQKLIYLKLSRNKITDEGLTQLLLNPSIRQLQVLLIEKNNIQGNKKQYKSLETVNNQLFLFY